MKIDLTYENFKEIKVGDSVYLPNGQEGIVVIECSTVGIGTDDPINYNKIQVAMDCDPDCCENNYCGCLDDHFISLWELYSNFNCEESNLHALYKKDDNPGLIFLYRYEIPLKWSLDPIIYWETVEEILHSELSLQDRVDVHLGAYKDEQYPCMRGKYKPSKLRIVRREDYE